MTTNGTGRVTASCLALVGWAWACTSEPHSDSATTEIKEPAPASAALPAASQKQASTAAAAPPRGKPFAAPKPFVPRSGHGSPVAPPDLSQETWRALVNQYRPHQKKTPHWQPLPADQRVELQMPPGHGYRCVVYPLDVTQSTNDFGTELKGWSLRRDMLCSSDGFRTWTEYHHRVRIEADGSRRVASDSEALLRERLAKGVRETVVRMRSEPRKLTASSGPPRILEGVEVDE